MKLSHQLCLAAAAAASLLATAASRGAFDMPHQASQSLSMSQSQRPVDVSLQLHDVLVTALRELGSKIWVSCAANMWVLLYSLAGVHSSVARFELAFSGFYLQNWPF